MSDLVAMSSGQYENEEADKKKKVVEKEKVEAPAAFDPAMLKALAERAEKAANEPEPQVEDSRGGKGAEPVGPSGDAWKEGWGDEKEWGGYTEAEWAEWAANVLSGGGEGSEAALAEAMKSEWMAATGAADKDEPSLEAKAAPVPTGPVEAEYDPSAPPDPIAAFLPKAQPEKPKVAKIDSFAMGSIMQRVKGNVSKVKEAAEERKEAPVAPGGVTSGGGGGGGWSSFERGSGGAGASVLESSPKDALLEAMIAKLKPQNVKSPEERLGLEREVISTIPRLDPPRATDLIIKVHALEGIRTQEFLDEVVKTLLPNMPKFSSPHLTRVLGTVAAWSLGTCGTDETGKVKLSEDVKRFFEGASTEISLRLMEVAPSDLWRIATFFSSVGLGEPKLFASLARAACARIDRFAPQEVVALSEAFEKASFVHTQLFEGLARGLRMAISEVSSRDLLKGMKSLAFGCVRDEELGQGICDKMLQKAAGLSAEDLCTMAWTFCALDLHHDHMFQTVFKTLEGAAVVGGDTLCQLYEIHSKLKAFHFESYKAYELELSTVQTLREHYKKQRGGKRAEQRLDRATDKLHEEVAKILKDVVDGNVMKQYQTPLAFTVDLGVTRRSKADHIIFFEIDGNRTLMQSLDPSDAKQLGHTSRVRGDVLLRRRVLQKCGYRLAVINEDFWNTLDGRSEKRDFLREVLKRAGVSKDRLL
eukprot:gnl/TRDRNA2_/TRDRNA2_144218_c0_seq2.p1 gnl/TRDRNA2_/TRDRNA2_144218_c0~~gnl/TRDRNA2_/TRDRNA2_144218_c0_seq2.p1  ORF type:complete len:733 (-),score=188.91 gnl/TRDRNA2_/TRDRNA2_144218_c0_seq2:75-2180(-)